MNRSDIRYKCNKPTYKIGSEGKPLCCRHANGMPDPIKVDDAPGRNDPCSCGSGKKYKKCCRREPILHVQRYIEEDAKVTALHAQHLTGERIKVTACGKDLREGDGFTVDATQINCPICLRMSQIRYLQHQESKREAQRRTIHPLSASTEVDS